MLACCELNRARPQSAAAQEQLTSYDSLLTTHAAVLSQRMFAEDTSCIILAGGLGTRLRGSIGDIPKCMAPIAGKPFLEYLLRYLKRQGIRNLIFSLGYRAEVIEQWLAGRASSFEITTVVETEPLGTGGGIRLAMERCKTATSFVVNGDTYFDVDLQEMYQWALRKGAETTLALKELRDFDRYGTVRMPPNPFDCGSAILGFQEKQAMKKGLINGGIYCIDREAFLNRGFPEKFSFEKDYLETFVAGGRFNGFVSDGYFIDIGVPEDFQRAQTDFQTLFPA
jgi:D-glycero-alpha-D-manno-heptose 1-phosphate guanylyltransferase